MGRLVRAPIVAVLVVDFECFGDEAIAAPVADLDACGCAHVLEPGAACVPDGVGAGLALVDGGAVDGVEAFVVVGARHCGWVGYRAVGDVLERMFEALLEVWSEGGCGCLVVAVIAVFDTACGRDRSEDL